MRKYLLIGNGFDIQFGGRAYTSRFIVQRIKYRAQMGVYDSLFEGTISGQEIVAIVNGFVTEANRLLEGKYDQYIQDDETKVAVNDFKKRYTQNIQEPYDIMIEDWLLIVHVFFLKNQDLEKDRVGATVAFKRILLDAIYNDGKIQRIIPSLEKQTRKALKRYLCNFDSIFTVNYDHNIESLVSDIIPVFHLHGNFDVLSESENPEYAMGYLRTQNGTTVYQEGLKHCYCNALLDYSGDLKRKSIEMRERLNATDFSAYSEEDIWIQMMRATRPLEYETILAKIHYPKLKVACDYHFAEFNKIDGELHIIGMSPNNDGHIFSSVLRNKNIKKIVFFYKSNADKNFIDANFLDSFQCRHVDDLWDSIGCKKPIYSIKIPENEKKAIEKFIDIFNALAQDDITTNEVIEEIGRCPQFERERLCKLVKKDMQEKNPEHKPTDKKDFLTQIASISNIALSEGVSPAVLYVLCIMNFDECFK